MGNTVTPLSRQLGASSTAVSTNTSFQITGATGVATSIPSGVHSIAVANATSGVFMFAGTGSDNTTYSVRIYAKFPIANNADFNSTSFVLAYIGQADVTLSSATFTVSTADLTGTTFRAADTIVWTAADPFLTLAAEVSAGTGTAYSPASNIPALLPVSYLGGATEVVFDYDMTGATGGIVFLLPQT